MILCRHNPLIVVSGFNYTNSFYTTHIECLDSQSLLTTHLNISLSDGARDSTSKGKLQGIRGCRSGNVTVPLECKHFHLISSITLKCISSIEEYGQVHLKLFSIQQRGHFKFHIVLHRQHEQK